jgi:hypothetical protein
MRFFSLLAIFPFFCSAACAADAVPATAYFPVLPLDAMAETVPQLVPVAANHALDGAHPGVTRAIIVIHDDTRDAAGALAGLSALAGAANTATMMMAPQFLLPSDVARFADHLPDRGRSFATWQMSGWPGGDDSVATQGQHGVSSFTVVDLFLMYLSDRSVFPDLKTIVIAGFGTGATFVQHYAAFNLAADAIDKENIDMRYVVAGTPSYLYLTASRPLGGRKGFGIPDLAACPDYNAYPYGMDKLNSYARRVGINAAKTSYALRFVTYLNAPLADANPETNCGALVQGNDSASRANNYKLYIQSLYSDAAERTQTFFTAKDAKNDAVGLYGSSCGMEVLFGDGLCPHMFNNTSQ